MRPPVLGAPLILRSAATEIRFMPPQQPSIKATFSSFLTDRPQVFFLHTCTWICISEDLCSPSIFSALSFTVPDCPVEDCAVEMAPTQPRPGRQQDPDDDFVAQFIQEEHQSSVEERPEALTTTEHQALLTQLQSVEFLMPNWAEKTKLNIARILGQWKRYFRLSQIATRVLTF